MPLVRYRFKAERRFRSDRFEGTRWEIVRYFIEKKHGLLRQPRGGENFSFISGYLVDDRRPHVANELLRLSDEDTVKEGACLLLIRKPVHGIRRYVPYVPPQFREEQQPPPQTDQHYRAPAPRMHPSNICRPLPAIVGSKVLKYVEGE